MQEQQTTPTEDQAEDQAEAFPKLTALLKRLDALAKAKKLPPLPKE